MGLDLEVAIDLHVNCIAPYRYGAKVYSRTAYRFDAADYDGATYYFEIVANNTDPSNASTITLRDYTNSTDVATVSVPANTTAWTRFRSTSFSPASGVTEYRLKTPTVAYQDYVLITVSRIVIVQVDATKTELVFPLVYDQRPSGVGSYLDDVTVPLWYGSNWSSWYQQGQTHRHDRSKLADIASGSPWTLSAVAMAASTKAAKLIFINVTDGPSTPLTATALDITGAGTGDGQWVYGSVAIADNATGFHSGDELGLNYESAMSYYAYWSRAELRVKLTNLSAATVHKAISGYDYGQTAKEEPFYRVLHTNANWQSGYTVDLEGWGGDYNAVQDDYCASETNGNSGAGTPVGSYIQWGHVDAALVRKRVSGLSFTDGYTIIGERPSTGTAPGQEYALLQLIYNVGSPGGGPSPKMNLMRNIW